MTDFLASVRNADEAVLALENGADIIDAKEPAVGALGRVDARTLCAILNAVNGRSLVSATIGDVDLAPEPVARAVENMAALGVDIIKIGIFTGPLEPTLARLGDFTARGERLVAVLFADRRPAIRDILASCAGHGFFGVMLDTADKSAGHLTDHLSLAELRGFVQRAHEMGLRAGLAGALRLEDVPALADTRADYLGFRSALTRGRRSDELSSASVAAVRHAIDAAAQRSASASSRATATAGATSAAREASRGDCASATLSKDA